MISTRACWPARFRRRSSRARPGVPIYDRKLSPDDVLARIERYHAPYHQVLNETCDRLHAEFGAVWHINCHSMPSNGSPRDEHGDFVLGDRDGTTCAPEFTDFVGSFLRGLGYDVRVNEGYKGVEIVRRQGRPGENRHSLQIEVDRSLYMDQRTLHRLPGFDRLRADLTPLVQAVGDFSRSRLEGPRHNKGRRTWQRFRRRCSRISTPPFQPMCASWVRCC